MMVLKELMVATTFDLTDRLPAKLDHIHDIKKVWWVLFNQDVLLLSQSGNFRSYRIPKQSFVGAARSGTVWAHFGKPCSEGTVV